MKMKKKGVAMTASVVALTVMVSAGSVSLIYNKTMSNQRAEYKAALASKDAELKRYQLSSVKGFALTKKLDAGDTVKEEDVTLIDMPQTVPSNVAATKEQVVGKVIKLTSEVNTLLTTSMLYDDGPLDDSLRKVELDYVRLPLRLDAKDVLDIRVVFPNGEDYRVLKKKRMQDVDTTAGLLFMNLTTEEILLMDSALVDAYIKNAEIYAVQYVEPEMQKEPILTYIPNTDVLKVIKADPDILELSRYQMAEEVRKALDARQAALAEGNKPRLGADLPAGSAVSKRKATVGATTNPSPSGSATPSETTTQEGDSQQPEGFVPNPEAGEIGE